MPIPPFPIPPEGPSNPDIIFVGEAGGSEEARLKQPFVGKSGKFLDQITSALGLRREDNYYTNVVKLQPPGNKIDSYFYQSQFSHAGEEWVEMLHEELNATDCNVIVALGNTALRATAGEIGINRWRGSPLVSSKLPGKVIIPTLHPSGILRGNYMGRYLLASDITKAKKFIELGQAALPQRTYYINPDYETTMEYIAECKEKGIFAFDLETGYECVELISLSNDPLTGISIPWGNSNRLLTPAQWREIKVAIKDLLEGPRDHIIAHNANYDTFYLSYFENIHTNLAAVDDTMVMASIMYPDPYYIGQKFFPLSLLSSLKTLEPFYKDDLETSKEIGDYELYQKYNIRDSIVTLEAFLALQPEIESGFSDTYATTMANLPATQEIQRNGLLVCEETRMEIKTEVISEIATLKIALNELSQPTLAQYLDPEKKRLEEAFAAREEVWKRPGGRRSEEAKELSAVISKIRTHLRQWNTEKDLTGPWELNPNADDKVMFYFYNLLGYKPITKWVKVGGKKVRKPTVDKDAMKALSNGTGTRKPSPEASQIVNLRSLAKLIDTYLNMDLFPDSRFRASYNIRGTKFGRFSSSQLFFHYGCNQQNIPPRVRRMFIPDRIV